MSFEPPSKRAKVETFKDETESDFDLNEPEDFKQESDFKPDSDESEDEEKSKRVKIIQTWLSLEFPEFWPLFS